MNSMFKLTPGFPEWERAIPSLYKRNLSKKEKVDVTIYNAIKKWLDTDNDYYIIMCNFKYIVNFFKGIYDNKLNVICQEYGYAFDELCNLKNNGKTAKDIAKEIINRNINSDSESSFDSNESDTY